jgi:putative ABC transport system substrate-binding protein
MKLQLPALVILLGVLHCAAAAEEPRLPRVGIVANTIPLAQWSGPTLVDGTPHAGHAIREGLEKLGWVDGRNVRLLWRSAEGNFDNLPSIFAELAAIPVDVIVAIGPGASAAAKSTSTVPIVVAISAGALGTAFVQSLARPNRNLTGLTFEARELEGKRLDLLKQVVPKATRVAMLEENEGCWGPTRVLKGAATRLGLTLLTIPFRKLGELEAAFASAAAQGAEAMLVCDGVYVYRYQYQREINALAMRYRLPIVHTASGGADNGGLMAYGIDTMVQYRRVPHFVDRILRGARPKDLPIEQPTVVELIVNQRVAKALGLTIPAAILVQADRVIE